MLEQSADAGFSLQFLVVYKTVKQRFNHKISDLDKHVKHKKGAWASECKQLEEERDAGDNFLQMH